MTLPAGEIWRVDYGTAEADGKPNAAQQAAHDCPADEVLYGGAWAGGKLLSLDTPLPTPTGWTTMGTVAVGDTVLDDRGVPCSVRYLSPVVTDGRSREVEFDDGSVILADAEHRWLTFTLADRQAMLKRSPEFRARRRASRPPRARAYVRKPRPDLAMRNATTAAVRVGEMLTPAPTGAVRTTAEITASLRTGGRYGDHNVNHAVPVAAPLILAAADLPLDPYLLGVWLGDGSKRSSTVTGVDADLFDPIRAAGWTVTGPGPDGKTWGVRGLVTALRPLGVLGDKHVPAAYLRGSADQRLALLQGLMDTDGNCNADGQAEFTNTSHRIASAVCELACSLGLRPAMTEGRSMLYGRDCGPKWTVKWTAALPVFRLARKLDRLPKAPPSRARWRYIVDVREIPSVPMRCIAVDSPSHLYLAGRSMIPTHNTDWGIAETLKVLTAYPGAAGLILRRTRPQLVQPGGIYPRLRTRLPRSAGRWAGNIFTFDSGSQLMLGHLNLGEQDLKNYLGGEYQVIFVDQAEQFLGEWLMLLAGRLRASGDLRARLEAHKYRGRLLLSANPGGLCVPYGDVLTPSGWWPIESFQPGDPVYSVTSAGELVEARVSGLIAEDYSGPIINTNTRGLHMAVTPNHRVAKVGGRRGHDRGRAFTLARFDELPGQATILRSVTWRGAPLPSFTCPIDPERKARRSTTRWQPMPMTLAGRDYAALLGWVLSEGSTAPWGVAISQSKPASRERLRRLLDRLGFPVYWTAAEATINSRDWGAHFRQFGLCRDKFIPDWIKAGTPEDLAAIFGTLMDGDGHWQSSDGGSYTTTSCHLADDVAEIALKLGYLVCVAEQNPPDRRGLRWVVHVKRVRSGGTEILTGQHTYNVTTHTKRASDIAAEHFTGKVYCLTVPGLETFVIRQRGSVWVSGNSHSWLHDRYIAPWPAGHMMFRQPTPAEPDPRTRAFIPASVLDNIANVGEDYKHQLDRMEEDDRRAAYGDWSVLRGSRFRSFSSLTHIVDPSEWPVPLGLGVRRVVAVDYGLVHPFAAIWLAMFDTDPWGAPIDGGMLVAYRELIQPNLTPAEQVDAILAAEHPDERGPGRPIPTVLSPDAWARDKNTPAPAWRTGGQIAGIRGPDDTPPPGSVAWHYWEGGLRARRADNRRIEGAGALAARLRIRDDQQPRLVLHSTCPQLASLIPRLERDPHRPEDVKKVDGDDGYDALRYGVAHFDMTRNPHDLPPSGTDVAALLRARAQPRKPAGGPAAGLRRRKF